MFRNYQILQEKKSLNEFGINLWGNNEKQLINHQSARANISVKLSNRYLVATSKLIF